MGKSCCLYKGWVRAPPIHYIWVNLVVYIKAGYELRQYEASKWVMTNLTTMVFTDNDDKAMFDKLFYYISGNNSVRKLML
jgi:hypothetical protein